jgi:hypothetical protein
MTTIMCVSNCSRRCKNGYRNVAQSLVAPNPGMVSKTRVKTGIIPLVPCNVGWPRGGPRNRGKGAPTRTATGPSERPRGDGDAGHLHWVSRARPHYVSSQAKSQPSLSLSLSLSSFRFLPKVSSPSRNMVSRPLFIFGYIPRICIYFFMLGRRRGNGVQQRIQFWHDGGISRPKWRKNDHDYVCLKSLSEV